MQDAKAECDQAAALRVDVGPSCASLATRYASAAAREATIAKAVAAQKDAAEKAATAQQDSAAKAKATRCGWESNGLQACENSCNNMMFNENDNAAFACDERCAAAHPTPDCE